MGVGRRLGRLRLTHQIGEPVPGSKKAPDVSDLLPTVRKRGVIGWGRTTWNPTASNQPTGNMHDGPSW